MRPIKFRVWDKKKKEMIPAIGVGWLYGRLDGEKWSFWQDVGKDSEECVANYKDSVLMQFTGLKDKNGKEAYEGDLVSLWHEEIGEIYWDNRLSLWDLRRPKDKSGFEETDWLEGELETGEIIGNIYENPELLE